MAVVVEKGTSTLRDRTTERIASVVILFERILMISFLKNFRDYPPETVIERKGLEHDLCDFVL